MKCSICNKELLPNGTCPICGNETDRLKIVQQSEDSEGMAIYGAQVVYAEIKHCMDILQTRKVNIILGKDRSICEKANK